MTLPENLAEGLNLAGTGMAVVLVALVVFMLILMALQKLFPGEELDTETPPELIEETILEHQAPVVTPPPVAEVAEPPATPEPPAPPEPEIQPPGRIPGAQIAAMAVSIYLAMEREEQAQPVEVLEPHPVLVPTASAAPASAVSPTALDAPQPRSGWGALGRASFLESQGRRAPSYNHRPQSPFNPRGRDTR